MLLALTVIFAGCKKDIEIINGDNWIIQIDDNNHIINGMIGDIGIKFCILNEDSIPTNVFKEGENFYFYFVIENLSDEEITIDGKSFSHDLFLVYDAESEVKIGKPYSGAFCAYVGRPRVVPIPENQYRVITLPWVYNDPQFYVNPYPFCCGQENSLLSKGVYSCRFEMDLQYKIGGKTRDGYDFLTDGKEKRIKGLSFEINFKIE